MADQDQSEHIPRPVGVCDACQATGAVITHATSGMRALYCEHHRVGAFLFRVEVREDEPGDMPWCWQLSTPVSREDFTDSLLRYQERWRKNIIEKLANSH